MLWVPVHDLLSLDVAEIILKYLLAKKVNEKPTAIHDLENGTARYNAGLVNRIEKALGVKIPRIRNKFKNEK